MGGVALDDLPGHLIDHAALGVATTAGESFYNKNFLDADTSLTLADGYRIVACNYYELKDGSALTLESGAVLCIL